MPQAAHIHRDRCVTYMAPLPVQAAVTRCLGHGPGEPFVVKPSCPVDSAGSGEAARAPEKKLGAEGHSKEVLLGNTVFLPEPTDKFQVKGR